MTTLLQGKRIFIVEDNVQNRVIFQIMLQKHGAFVDFERWGREAIRNLQAMKVVDLIILDLMLAQGISGFDVFDQIREMPTYANVPIIAVSAAEPAIAMPKALEKGFSGFIAKPIDDRLFPSQVSRVIAGERIWHSGGTIMEV